MPENVDDVDTTDNFDYHARRVLSPLEVRAIPTIPKPANENTHSTTNTTTTKRKKSKSTKDDGFFFSDDMDEKLAMFAAHKEKLKKQKEAETNTNNKNKLKPAKEPEKTAEQTTTPINSKNNKPLVKPTTLVPTPITPPPKATPQPSFYQAVPSTAPPISRPKKKVDVELENKIRDKMAAVQLWQTKCGELRKQVYLLFFPDSLSSFLLIINPFAVSPCNC